MKILLLGLFVVSYLFGEVYYAKVEPYEIRTISSNVSGVVLEADENRLGKVLSDEAYIVIDSELDAKELIAIEKKLEYVKTTLLANETIVRNLEESLVRKRENYKRVASLSIKSTIEKDKEFYDLVTSENQLLTTQKEIESLKMQIADLELRQATLQRNVADKHLKAKSFMLYSLDVKPGQVVSMATPLAKIADVSKAKLTLYLDPSDVTDVTKKVVYIDGVKSDYKISRILRIADSKNISKYMAQIIMKAPELFSNLVKVELKNE